MKAYLSFLLLWVLIFAYFYRTLGVGKGQDLDIFDYLADSWTMSTNGNDDLISDNYWKIDADYISDAYGDKDLNIKLSNFMTFFVGLVKYIN